MTTTFSVYQSDNLVSDQYNEVDLAFTTVGNTKVSKSISMTGNCGSASFIVDSTTAATISLIDAEATAALGVNTTIGSTASAAAGSYTLTDVGEGTLAAATTVTKTAVTTSGTHTIRVDEAGAGDTQGQIIGTVNVTTPITHAGDLTVTIDGGTPVVVSLAGTETSTQVVAAINAGITTQGLASISGGKLKIVSATQGASSSVQAVASANDLGLDLGIDNGSGVATKTKTDGTNGTGRWSIVTNGVATQYHAGTVAVTAIPGLSIVVATTVDHASESATLKVVGQVGILTVDLQGAALRNVKLVVDGSSVVPVVTKAVATFNRVV